MAYTVAESHETYDRWLSHGYFRLTDTRTLVYTWKGATLFAWRSLFPWKHITKLRHANEARAVLRRFEA